MKVVVAQLTEDSSHSCIIDFDVMDSQDGKQQLCFIIRCPRNDSLSFRHCWKFCDGLDKNSSERRSERFCAEGSGDPEEAIDDTGQSCNRDPLRIK